MPSRILSFLRAHPRLTWGVVALVGVGAIVAAWALSRPKALDPSRPAITADPVSSLTVPVSMIAAPIRIPLSRLAALLEDAVPREYGSLDQREDLPGHDRTDLAFELRRGPFVTRMKGSTATLRTTVEYRVRVYYDPPVLPEISGSCGTDDDHPPPRLAVTLQAPVTVDSLWRLKTRAQVASIRPASDEDRDRCTMTFLGLDMTGRIADAARRFLEGHVEQMDTLAAETDVRSSFDSWWRTLQEPIHLTDSLWLSFRPEAIRRGRVQGTRDSLRVPLALQARPTLGYGPRPFVPRRALPPLDSGQVGNGLDLRVEARVDYPPASELLQQELGGRVLEHDGRSVTLDSLQVFGIGGGRLAVELDVSGDVSGRLYLVGTPRIDPETGRISVPDLDFDLATRDVVVAVAAWIREDELRDLLRGKASWSAAPAVEFLTRWLEKGLNRDLSDDLRVEGRVSSVRIVGVRALQSALLIQVAAEGTAEIFVSDSPGAGGSRP